MKVALVMVAVGDLRGSGGAERSFADLFAHLRRRGRDEVALVTARASMDRLREAGRLASEDGVVALPLGRKPAQGRVGIAWMTLVLLWVTLTRRYDLVHVCLPTPSYVPYAAVLAWLPRAWRPKLAITVIDCTLAPNLASGHASDLYEQQVLDAHRMYFRWARLDGVYSWYEAFVSVSHDQRLLPGDTIVSAARYCFTEPDRFRPAPAKEPLVVFAGRLSEQKRPLLFVDAVAALRARVPALVAAWHFEMYGQGVLEREVKARIAQHGLGGVITLAYAIDMAPVFARSRLFVSTQAFENFTSLAMLEAMAAGNAVVAEDVGQTRLFVQPNENGALVSPATAEGFADAMAAYLRHPERHDAMAAASRTLTTDVHTIEHFTVDLTKFWGEVLERR